MATFVLVPGGWHGGWYFQFLAEALRARGHRAYPITLTGLGERRHLLGADVNLDTHIHDVIQILQMENLSQVILLGHSYGGMVISGVVDRVPDRVATAIYSDAYVPSDGQSCFELANDLFRKLFLDGAAADRFQRPATTPARSPGNATSHGKFRAAPPVEKPVTPHSPRLYLPERLAGDAIHPCLRAPEECAGVANLRPARGT
jgi:pimeloyl-ACP methyl ester carboxylesterase